MPQVDGIGTLIGKIIGTYMKIFNYIVVSLAILMLSTGCYAGSQAKQSWWLELKLEARDTELQGLPVSDFNADWKSASFIDGEEVRKRISVEDYQEFAKSSFSFNKDMDLNGNGMSESIHVGVYKNSEGGEGVFLAIFENDRLIKLLTDNTHKNFSALLIDRGQLLWYRCMQCGNFEKLVWTGSSYFLE